ncbi:hypothetical protein Anapl_00780 [Anas platyrhynchos]|uniref:Uncharacterized protein n=1 Tax=Anas platyrhynchos TaxID=8839 RepID=R0LJA4_ANAPL|nr:hypothetical protein Anapl_00780 [Anas platyrhynchos]
MTHRKASSPQDVRCSAHEVSGGHGCQGPTQPSRKSKIKTDKLPMHKTAIIVFTSQFVSMAIPSVKHISVGPLRVVSINQAVPVDATTQVSLLFEKCLGGPTAKAITADNSIQKSLSKAVRFMSEVCACLSKFVLIRLVKFLYVSLTMCRLCLPWTLLIMHLDEVCSEGYFHVVTSTLRCANCFSFLKLLPNFLDRPWDLGSRRMTQPKVVTVIKRAVKPLRTGFSGGKGKLILVRTSACILLAEQQGAWQRTSRSSDTASHRYSSAAKCRKPLFAASNIIIIHSTRCASCVGPVVPAQLATAVCAPHTTKGTYSHSTTVKRRRQHPYTTRTPLVPNADPQHKSITKPV